MQAVLLAGGLGTRLRSVVNDRPKPMALVEGYPFMEYLIHQLKSNGIEDIVMAVGYKGSMVEDYFQDGSKQGVRIQYSYEEEPLGTAGAIKNAAEKLTDESFFVLNADTFYKMDYSRLIESNLENDAIMTLVLREVEDISRYGKATLTDGILTGFNEKSADAEPGTINGGVYLIRKKMLDYIPEGKVSLENEVIPRLLNGGITISGIVNDGYFIDIGIPEDYFKFIEDVKCGTVHFLK